jgi:LPPG:FO 2-phospho-L-lactate transferase
MDELPHGRGGTGLYTVLAGGVGASRFLQGLVQVVDPEDVTVISNTGDDVEMFGLHVSPDVDIVIYALAGAVNPATGWGLDGDTLNVVQALRRYGYGDWFNLGDKDLATAIHRTRLLREGRPMHEVIAEIATAWGLRSRILPMSNETIRTRIVGPEGEIPFQDYMVRLRTEVDVRAIEFAGIESARPAPGVIEAIQEAGVVVLAPSNPFVSVGPILAVPGVREALETTRARRVAVSPIIAGQVVKGPAAKMMATLGHEVSAAGVAAIYRGLIDVMVIDEQDRDLAPRIEALGLECGVADTMMTSDTRKAEVARDTLAAVGVKSEE